MVAEVETTLVPRHVAASLHEEAPAVAEAPVVLPVVLPQDCAILALHHKAHPLALHQLLQEENQLLKEGNLLHQVFQWVLTERWQELIKVCSCQWASLPLPPVAALAGSALHSGLPRHLRHPVTPTHPLALQ